MKNKKIKVIILSGYGLNCEEETKFAFEWAGAKKNVCADIVHINDLIKKPKMLLEYQILVFPGGFSYGDDTGSGKAYANKFKNHLAKELAEVIIPKINQIIKEIDYLAKKYNKLPMLARTHGQPASPTTFGKEFKVFSERLKKQLDKLKEQKISVKFSGATGNFNAHLVAFPKIDWIKFAKNFIEKLNVKRIIKLELNFPTTQIDPHDSEVEIFDTLRRINTILIDFNQDIWRYISDEWIVQKPADGTVGSSTMPHKINPIKFENSEGNLGMANSFFEFFARKLPISRLQRDLSDSTVERNFGSALAYCLVAYEYLLKGLARISVDENKVKQDLNNYPEVITEAIQTILRREGVKMPYEKLKELTRGKQVTLKDIHNFIKSLEISDKIKKELLKITPENYIGLASKIASI